MLAITQEFSNDLDALIILEGDVITELNPEDFFNTIKKGYELGVERGSKQSQRENENEIKSLRVDVRTNLDKSRDEMDKTKQVIDGKMDKLSREMDNKIKQALDNPLSK